MKLSDGKNLESPDNIGNDELVTYADARKSNEPKPYIAAVITLSGLDENKFILGDGRNTSNPAIRRRRAAPTNYYNGPLESGASYRIFQRVFIEKVKSELYIDCWSNLIVFNPSLAIKWDGLIFCTFS